MDNYITINSYPKVWRIEKKIYSFGNKKLPLAIAPWHVAYFLAIVILMRFSGFAWIPWAIRYGIIPFVVSQFLLKAKLDGKSPLRYFPSLLVYGLHRSQYVSGFTYHARLPGVTRLRWFCRRGDEIRRVENAEMPD